MAFTVTHRDGSMERSENLDALAALLRQLNLRDVEHPDVAASDDSGWTLSAYATNVLVLENVEDDSVGPRHLADASRDAALTLMRALASGDWETVEHAAWSPGYGIT